MNELYRHQIVGFTMSNDGMKTPGSISLPARSAFGAQVHVWGCVRKREKYLIANVQLLFRSGTLYGKCGAKEIWSADQLKFWTQKGGRVWTACGLQHELRVCFQKDSTGDILLAMLIAGAKHLQMNNHY